MKQTEPEVKQHCGLIAIVGRPNVGKSTLLNHLIGEKISITSRKPQTTRHRVNGIFTQGFRQLVFIDTPGLHRHAARAINRHMNRAATSSLLDVDVVIFVVDSTAWNEDDEMVLERVKNARAPVILFINKVDKMADKHLLLPHLDVLSKRFKFDSVIPGSALKGDQLDTLKSVLFQRLPEMAFIFPQDYITDRSERFLAAEMIREKLMRSLGDEIPYSCSVEIELFRQADGGILEIYALILVERTGQKRVVIGEKGQRLKRVGTEARLDMERLFGQRVFLKLWVKVKEGWADDERALKSLGYTDYQG